MQQSKAFVLLIDSGNSRIKCRVLRVTVQGLDTENYVDEFVLNNDQYHLFERELKKLQRVFGRALGIFAISVASLSLRTNLDEMCIKVFNRSIEWLRVEKSSLYLNNHYDVQQLGVDRWYGVLGAYQHYSSMYQQMVANDKTAFLYISFGTATTIDAVVGNDYLGGVILPGVRLMQKSLYHGTAQLPDVHDLVISKDIFPRNTQEAIETGIVRAQAGAVLRQIQTIQQFHCLPLLYISGGARNSVITEIQSVFSNQADIPKVIELEAPVLDGLMAYIASRNFS
ncbi:pantothenate kinase [Pelistega indica]|uniref:Type III pantothenate kinase n=1 Tax=Pelistega indica TaxID=1414851 RepID=V8G488_9BURK|nr:MULTISPECIES: type III pantothenate kinase [Pelistega]ETD70778.1 pantothenate kinase [Pelistega indica]